MTVLLDSNVLFSAILFGGIPKKILGLISEGSVRACTSPSLIEELLETLRKKTSLRNEQLLAIKSSIEDMFTIVSPREEISVCRDPDDNEILEAAIRGKSRYLVTRDDDLKRDLELIEVARRHRVRVVSVRQFLRSLSRRSRR